MRKQARRRLIKLQNALTKTHSVLSAKRLARAMLNYR